MIAGSFIFFQKNISSVNPFIGNLFLITFIVSLIIVSYLIFNERIVQNKIIQITILVVCILGSLIKMNSDFKKFEKQNNSSVKFDQNKTED